MLALIAFKSMRAVAGGDLGDVDFVDITGRASYLDDLFRTFSSTAS